MHVNLLYVPCGAQFKQCSLQLALSWEAHHKTSTAHLLPRLEEYVIELLGVSVHFLKGVLSSVS